VEGASNAAELKSLCEAKPYSKEGCSTSLMTIYTAKVSPRSLGEKLGFIRVVVVMREEVVIALPESSI
jgi:hypothetical protein